MKAIGIKKSLPIDNPNSFIAFETEKPTAGPHDLLVKVKAVSVNPVDYKVRQNVAKDKELEEPRILGWDAAGVVEAVGEKVKSFKVGDEVYYAGDLNRPGSNAEYQVVDERLVGHKPSKISFAEAAAMPLTTLTAGECIFDRLPIRENEGKDHKILIINGAGGVGSIAVQLLSKLTHLHVIATASREESRKWCMDHGADIVIDHDNLVENMNKEGLADIDYILNFSDTNMHWDAMAELVKPQGHICTIVETKEPVDINKLKNKSVALHWELMFTRSMFQTPDMDRQHEILENLAVLLQNGKITSTLNKTFKGLETETFIEAHKLQESGTSIGKNVIVF